MGPPDEHMLCGEISLVLEKLMFHNKFLYLSFSYPFRVCIVVKRAGEIASEAPEVFGKPTSPRRGDTTGALQFNTTTSEDLVIFLDFSLLDFLFA